MSRPLNVAVQRALTASADEIAAQWEQDRADTIGAEIVTRREQQDTIATAPIYPRECAVRLADELRPVAPDWRTARPTFSAAWRKLLEQQPELAREHTRRREAITTSLLNQLPPELHRAVHELRALIEGRLIAHETAAFLVGWEAGRDHEVRHASFQHRHRPRGRALALNPPQHEREPPAIDVNLDALADRLAVRLYEHTERTATTEHVCPLVSLPDGGTTLNEIERTAIHAALRRTQGHQRRAAAVLGISERVISYKIRHLQIANDDTPAHVTERQDVARPRVVVSGPLRLAFADEA